MGQNLKRLLRALKQACERRTGIRGGASEQIMEITVKDVSSLQEYVLKIRKTNVEIWPVKESDGKPLEGVQLELRSSDGTVVARWTSSKGWEEIRNVTPGTYTIHAVSVPDGFALPDDEEIMVESVTDLQRFTIKVPEAETGGGSSGGSGGGSAGRDSGQASGTASGPKTGDNTPVSWYLSLLGMALTLILALILRKTRKGRRGR